MKRTLVVLFALLLIGFSGYANLEAGQEGTNPGKAVPVTQLGPKRSGPRWSFTDGSGICDQLRIVIRDRDAWSYLWKRIYTPVCPTLPPLPDIDFSREMVVVVGLGTRPSSGYGIIVDGAYERGERLEVEVRSVTVKGCGQFAVMTVPLDIVRLPKIDRPVVFREIEVVQNCK